MKCFALLDVTSAQLPELLTKTNLFKAPLAYCSGFLSAVAQQPLAPLFSVPFPWVMMPQMPQRRSTSR
jgi:hypothetical protein